MNFKPAVWHPIAVGLSVLNFAAAGYAVALTEPWHAAAHVAAAFAFGLWARRLRLGPGEGAVAGLKEQLERHAVALEDTQTTLADQSTQLAELQERMDFTERLLAQARDRQALGNREERG